MTVLVLWCMYVSERVKITLCIISTPLLSHTLYCTDNRLSLFRRIGILQKSFLIAQIKNPCSTLIAKNGQFLRIKKK